MKKFYTKQPDSRDAEERIFGERERRINRKRKKGGTEKVGYNQIENELFVLVSFRLNHEMEEKGREERERKEKENTFLFGHEGRKTYFSNSTL